jgi:hypothetical protein
VNDPLWDGAEQRATERGMSGRSELIRDLLEEELANPGARGLRLSPAQWRVVLEGLEMREALAPWAAKGADSSEELVRAQCRDLRAQITQALAAAEASTDS